LTGEHPVRSTTNTMAIRDAIAARMRLLKVNVFLLLIDPF
jgi:hypothetical protein